MTLGAAVIGLGVGEAHAEAYSKNPHCKLVAVCDLDPEKLASAERKFPGVKVTTNADEILNAPNVDVVSVASYENYHFEQSVKAIKNGKHLFVEKPFCIHEDEAKTIRELLRKNPKIKLSSNLILRNSPRFLELKKLAEQGTFGKLYLVEADYNYGRVEKILQGWRGKIPFYSVVYGGGVHMIDLLHWISGDEVVEVEAMGTNRATLGSQFRFNDTVISLLRFKSGLIGKMAANYPCVYPHTHKISIYGTGATFENHSTHGSLYKTSSETESPQRIDAPVSCHKGGLIESFINSILNKGEAIISIEDVFKSMAVCFAIEKASKTKKSVLVDEF